MIVLDGLPALSAFRIDRLNAELAPLAPGCTVRAAHWVYFIDADPPGFERARACQILDALDRAAAAASLWAVPRIGTRSPWSSKATEILRGCGLALRRVERGIAFDVDGMPAAAALRERVTRVLHDPMTQTVVTALDEAAPLFAAGLPAPLRRIELGADPLAALRAANVELGLALADDEIAYLAACYGELRRAPSDAELMMFAQANSEHCRHKIFNAQFTVDGVAQPQSLFAMIRNTHAQSPAHTLSAYHDNAAVIAGSDGQRFFADADDATFRAHGEAVPYAIKVETHNHPTAISPYPGASTGAGGEIRDEGATGRGGKPKAGLVGYTVSDLRIPGLARPWERQRALPPRFASAFEIMRDAPLGAAAFNNEFGRPCLGGYFRAFEQDGGAPGLVRGYDKPIMIAGGLANLRAGHVDKRRLVAGDCVIVLGGPAMLIGLGGGAASSVAAGSSSEQLDFASVQRDNAEMQRRCQEVIDACCARGERNPIVSIHDVGAGGLSNAIPELLNDSGVGGRIELERIPSDDARLSPMQVWCNEAQERYVLGVRPDDLPVFEAICARERCPHAVVGHASAERHLWLTDARFASDDPRRNPIDLPLDVLFGKPPRMQRQAQRANTRVDLVPDLDGIVLDEAVMRVLSLPTVGSKSFLVTIGDRSVGGLCARDQMVGPWQVPVADCAVTLLDFDGCAGEAMAMGERTPLALIDAAASARMAVGEALTNLCAAEVALDEVRLSANWMAAAGFGSEDAALFDAVHAVGIELCPALGISIPVGKDSLSMQVQWSSAVATARGGGTEADRGAHPEGSLDAGSREEAVEHRTVAPVSLIVSAFARTPDVRRALTPQLVLDRGDSEIWLLDLGAGRNRLGGSALLQAYGHGGGDVPDLDDAPRFKAALAALAQARAADLLLAWHDRSDGGLYAALVEMALAGHCGLDVALDGWGENVLSALFSEELGVLVQVRRDDRDALLDLFTRHGVATLAHRVAVPDDKLRVRVTLGSDVLAEHDWARLMRCWSQTSHAMQRQRDNPISADAEYEARCDVTDPGLSPRLMFDPAQDIAAPYIARGARPRVAILREQGVNGQLEMAAAFTRAGFDAIDVHMSDLAAGRCDLAQFRGLAACGGFSYGDVLGAGRGWAASVLWNERLREQFATYFARPDTFTIGVCNGCQMLSRLKDIIPGAAHWPHFVRNASEQYEARLVSVEVVQSPSILLQGMAGSCIPVVVAHGEGRVEFADPAAADQAHLALRFVDNAGCVTERFPYNANGSVGGATGFTSEDGRATICMPHPERVFRSVQMSWRPREWGEASPWLRLFRNARAWVG
ncbi:MAG: phosphoribosylformylglycinamidine synthase [Dokdonella sp.]|uniref:phosphoribosylformylglycinamidine synthase n=1 Tax=Dokdonella sp. TaxID=2291710 RepID=UPI0025BDF2F2|nr:phosphoribosylformylglycinamidine synthase [Dokdonella sp.]MBX3701153.1 phosphoribosylformylglycinamidine synthase [Dokdonella sp.]